MKHSQPTHDYQAALRVIDALERRITDRLNWAQHPADTIGHYQQACRHILNDLKALRAQELGS
jgi:hypothetical protein